jgi:L-threonate 2-dehydrogenase
MAAAPLTGGEAGASCDKLFHVGEAPGQGAMVKTVKELLCGVHIPLAAEALTLPLRPASIRPFLSDPVELRRLKLDAEGRRPRMLRDKPPVASPVDISSSVLDAGRASKVALPLPAAAHQMFLAASGLGHGTRQVLRAYAALNARSPRSED